MNASPIILLAKVGLVQQATALPESCVIPKPVAEEILLARKPDEVTVWLQNEGRCFVRPASRSLTAARDPRLGTGERAVIARAAAHPGFVGVDDFRARDTARRRGIPGLGTVGVLVRLKRAGRIPELKTVLLQIRQAGGYISDDLLKETLRAVGESL